MTGVLNKRHRASEKLLHCVGQLAARAKHGAKQISNADAYGRWSAEFQRLSLRLALGIARVAVPMSLMLVRLDLPFWPARAKPRVPPSTMAEAPVVKSKSVRSRGCRRSATTWMLAKQEPASVRGS